MTRITRRPAVVLLTLLTTLAAFFVVVPGGAPTAAAPSAPAQTCSSIYGCPGTTTTGTTTPVGPDGGIPQCIVSRTSGAIGVSVDVTITNVPVGLQVNLLLNGATVDSAIAGGTGNAVASLDAGDAQPKSARSAASTAAPAQAALADVHFDFRVPTGPAGSYELAAAGNGFHCDCFPFTILRDVRGDTTPNPDNGGNDLARTGFAVLGLLVLATMLLILGRAMVEASRRRNRSAVS